MSADNWRACPQCIATNRARASFAFLILKEGIETAASGAQALLPAGSRGEQISEWAADIVRDL